MNLVEYISRLLNDYESGYENIRWSKDEVQSYIDEACEQVSILSPEAFSSTMQIELKAGREQTLPNDINELISINGMIDEFGRLIAIPLKRAQANMNIVLNYFADLKCDTKTASGEYKPTGYQVSDVNSKVFFIDPPVPVGAKVKLSVNVAVKPNDNSIKEISNSKYRNAIVEWALYRAFGKDTESQNDSAVSNQHLQHFYSIVQNIRAVDGGINNLHGMKHGND